MFMKYGEWSHQIFYNKKQILKQIPKIQTQYIIHTGLHIYAQRYITYFFKWPLNIFTTTNPSISSKSYKLIV